MEFDYRTSIALGKQILGGHKQNLVHTRSQEKGAVSLQETDPDLPVSVQESPVDRVLSELSTMTSWVALHGMAHSFIELDKAVIHVISLVSFL